MFTICEYRIILLSLSPKSERSMIVTFEEDYLRELYEDGQTSDKKQLSNHYKNS